MARGGEAAPPIETAQLLQLVDDASYSFGNRRYAAYRRIAPGVAANAPIETNDSRAAANGAPAMITGVAC